MFVNNEVTERGLLHRMLDRVKNEVTLDERMAWARSIDGAINDAAGPGITLRNRVARPAIATPIPVPGGTPTVLLDAGANAECQPQWLVQFAQMGAVFARRDRLSAVRPRPRRPPCRRCAASPARLRGSRAARATVSGAA
jgi:hypothetical protein